MVVRNKQNRTENQQLFFLFHDREQKQQQKTSTELQSPLFTSPPDSPRSLTARKFFPTSGDSYTLW